MLDIQDQRVLKSLSVLCVITQLKKITPSVNTESESMVLLIRFMKKHCYSVKSARFHLLKKAFLLSICTENMIVLSPSILKMFECNKCDFSAMSKGVLKYHERQMLNI